MIHFHRRLNIYTIRGQVSAGDSFTATVCTGLIRGRSLTEVNTFANQVAAYVCTQQGACPTLPEEIKLS
ncbi:MAG: PfkB family carbohydrate kinase [Planctomycetaceae bacterium]